MGWFTLAAARRTEIEAEVRTYIHIYITVITVVDEDDYRSCRFVGGGGGVGARGTQMLVLASVQVGFD